MARAEARRAPDPGVVRRLGELLRARTRLQMRPRNMEIIERVAERRAAERGAPVGAYLEHVILSHDTAELESFIAEITVGETHFFRGPPQFEALRNEIVPSLLHKRRKERVLTALSAGCATGEEAYSLAIVLREAAMNDGFRVEVTGIDLNPRALQKAESARYSAWSLRDVPEVVRRMYFRTEGETWHLSEDVRRLVRFRRFGLTEGPLVNVFPKGFDLILCQNVLYYLEPEARPEVIASLAAALAPGGILMFGPVDHAGDVPGCRAVHVGEVVVHERFGPVSVPPSSPRGRRYARLSIPPVPLPELRMEAAAAPPVAPAAPPPPSPEPAPEVPAPAAAPSLASAFAHADAGNLENALAELEALLEEEPEEPRAHLLEGLLLVELGGFEAALDAFRRCVYLDPSMMLAHAGAAVAGLRLGRPDLVERHAARLRALTVARGKGVDAPIEGWDGMTVGRLLRLFRDTEIQ
ncbi:CheR family methyltransferase [Polyangium jinanense]|uniref:Methyltransferase domain-containing protein n=1 Tax=Polyangium jinanense TaxID=2829994 RepID=A0A9X4ASS8_9BACT|nr:CheR family methyltransferase [Polyangium jinanense]MDC3957945.1 methyltransferase domain-containing protein [Polyangium jinanense]MDC3983498.1 methyltransferase domain-containing protein [Polyangium jinanense]